MCSFTSYLLTNVCLELQASFFRKNLHIDIVRKQKGRTKEGGMSLPLEDLADFIRSDIETLPELLLPYEGWW